MSTLRYEPDEKCPPLLLIGTAVQAVTLVLAMTILIVAITVRASGQEDGLLVWASFATLVVVGITMALQASKIGRFGGGHLIVCGVTPNYIAISIIALAEGGPSMLASLIVISAVFYYAVATWLPLLRRIITPTVAGTVLMLIAALIIPFALKLIRDTPETAHPFDRHSRRCSHRLRDDRFGVALTEYCPSLGHLPGRHCRLRCRCIFGHLRDSTSAVCALVRRP